MKNTMQNYGFLANLQIFGRVFSALQHNLTGWIDLIEDLSIIRPHGFSTSHPQKSSDWKIFRMAPIL
jgi:hypothetical protein